MRLHTCAVGLSSLVHQISERNGAAVAQKVQILLIDDFDGSEADGTVRFGLDGTTASSRPVASHRLGRQPGDADRWHYARR